MEFDSLLIQIHEILHRSMQKYKEEIISKSRHSDITVSQLFYMEALFNLQNPTLTELAGHLNVSKASASVAVQKLIGKGLVKRVPSGGDGRAFNIGLSADGKRLVEAEIRAVAEFIASIKRSLSDEEIRNLTSAFQKVIDGYRK